MVKLSPWSIATFVLLFASVILLPMISSHRAFADGLWQENLPPANLGGKEASLFVRVNPPILLNGTGQDTFVQFRLFDVATNESFTGTTFFIKISKGVANDAPALVQDFFYSDSGLVTLRIKPSNVPVTIYGNQEGFLDAWQADPGGNIRIDGPILQDGGLYHFHVELFTVGTVRDMFATYGFKPVFDSYLSVGDYVPSNITYQGQTYNTTLVSYYDRTSDFSFNANTKTFAWSMPFDWNTSRIKAAPSFLVHEELRIPTSMTGVGDTGNYAATLNGQALPNSLLLKDPYTYPDAMVIHYLLGKRDVLNYANQTNDKTAMHFTLAPSTASVPTQNETSGLWTGERSNALVQWTPSQLSSGAGSTVHIEFIDSQGTGQKIAGDVYYDLKVFDQNNKLVFIKPGLVAKNGTDTQTLIFPGNSKYAIQAKITSINLPNLPPDIRPDIVTGTVVVPEFPVVSLVAVVGVGGVIVLARKLL